jgi:hypothetical protein
MVIRRYCYSAKGLARVMALKTRWMPLLLILSWVAVCSTSFAQERTVMQVIATDPAVQQNALVAVKQSAVVVNNPCPTAQYALTGKGEIYVPPERDASGVVTKGAFKLEFREDGCGASRILNVYGVVQSPGKLALAPLLPGTTHASPQMQRDAINVAGAAAGPPEKDCKINYIADTQLVRQEAAPAAGATAVPWQELWTLVSCTRRAQVPMRFIPQRNGTQIVSERAKIEPSQGQR